MRRARLSRCVAPPRPRAPGGDSMAAPRPFHHLDPEVLRGTSRRSPWARSGHVVDAAAKEAGGLLRRVSWPRDANLRTPAAPGSAEPAARPAPEPGEGAAGRRGHVRARRRRGAARSPAVQAPLLHGGAREAAPASFRPNRSSCAAVRGPGPRGRRSSGGRRGWRRAKAAGRLPPLPFGRPLGGRRRSGTAPCGEKGAAGLPCRRPPAGTVAGLPAGGVPGGGEGCLGLLGVLSGRRGRRLLAGCPPRPLGDLLWVRRSGVWAVAGGSGRTSHR